MAMTMKCFSVRFHDDTVQGLRSSQTAIREEEGWVPITEPAHLEALTAGQRLSIYNYLTKGKPIKDFPAGFPGAVERVWLMLTERREIEAPATTQATDDSKPVANNESESTMTSTHTATNGAAKAKGKKAKADKPAKKAKADKPAKAKADKPAKKAKAEKPAKAKGERKPGVIESIKEILQNGGGTISQIHGKLCKKFPDRNQDSMLTTCKIQMTRLVTDGRLKKINKEKTEAGIVYSA